MDRLSEVGLILAAGVFATVVCWLFQAIRPVIRRRRSIDYPFCDDVVEHGPSSLRCQQGNDPAAKSKQAPLGHELNGREAGFRSRPVRNRRVSIDYPFMHVRRISFQRKKVQREKRRPTDGG